MWNPDHLSSDCNVICIEFNLSFYFSVITLRGFFCRSSANLFTLRIACVLRRLSLCSLPLFPDFMNKCIVQCCKRLPAVSLPGKIGHLCPPSMVCFQLQNPPGGGFPAEGFLKVSGWWLCGSAVCCQCCLGRGCVLCPLALLLPRSEPSLQTTPTGNEPNKFQMNADLVVLYWLCTNAGVSLGSVQSGKCTCLCLLLLIETVSCLSCSLGWGRVSVHTLPISNDPIWCCG